MGGEEVIELSVQETNDLRAKLGLAPLRGVGDTAAINQQQQPPSASSEEVLELSVGDTNELREKLGLAPLRVTDEDSQTGKSARQVVHKPAENAGQAKETQERMEKARLEREVQRGISSTFAAGSLADDNKEEGSDALSWAAKMRAQKETPAAAETKKTKKKGRSAKTKDKYDEADLQGLNVAHNLSELDAGSTTIMTLADAPLLKTKDETSGKVVGLNEEEQTLENVELISQQKQRDGLQKKRQLELGMGRAGGYAGFDDDEFEELSGSMGPSRLARGEDSAPAERKGKSYGFQIGDAFREEQKGRGSDLFASHEGKGISLEPAQADVTASDVMTVEEDEALLEKSGKKRKKDTKFKKKKKKEKKNRRKKDAEGDQDEAVSSKGFLDELEATAVKTERPSKRKRRRSDSETEEASPESEVPLSMEDTDVPMGEEETAKKRARFDATMAKGNARTAEAFKTVTTTLTTVDDEPDDAFLNAALAKARRLRRLKEMSAQKTNKGADAVAQALLESREQSKPEESSEGGVTFAVDDTREFTRALQARAEQVERQQARKAQAMAKKVVSTTSAPKNPETQVETVDEPMHDKDEEEDIADLAKEIKEDDMTDLEGTTASTVSVGRGMSNVLSLLRQTGEISGKNGGKEELRGRSKDERNYENYESLDLSKVVKIGENATDKDKEFANREVKLEYRDAHGRLLTTKEAWRNLCYDFHGHGSSLKNEERKLRQIAREQAEARLASRQVADDTGAPAGSLGALKATQKATGKAFVIHKT